MTAEKYATLYGLKYEGRKRVGSRMRHVFVDLLTDNTLRVAGLSSLATAVQANRSPAFSKAVSKEARQRAVELSERFHGFKARKVHKVEIEWPDSLVCLGAAVRVDYISDKFDGEVRRYFHEFESPVVLYCDAEPQPDGSNLLVIIGKFTIEPDGITG